MSPALSGTRGRPQTLGRPWRITSLFIALAVSIWPLSGGISLGDGTTHGTIVTAGDAADILDDDLAAMIDEFIPPETCRLIIFTQCYGGNALCSFMGANTAVASATSPGQQAQYGGYDSGASGALAPGAGNTGQTVHDAGTQSADPSETPSTGGGKPLGDVSLEDTSDDGDVHSRHIVIFSGQPDPGAGRNNDQRDMIRGAFMGQANTTVTAVGGDGMGGWDKPGNAMGLRDALREIGDSIGMSADPSKEQFILYVTDHGDLDKPVTLNVAIPPGQTLHINSYDTFHSGDVSITQVLQNGRPGFSVFIPFQRGQTYAFDPNHYVPFFRPGDWLVRVAMGKGGLQLTQFMEHYYAQNGNVIGATPGDGVQLLFPVPPQTFPSFFDVFIQVDIFNRTSGPRMGTYTVGSFGETTGPVRKGP